uniref:Uncharacterized protein n=1 Tax=Arion vulgaris TaxID=1028688 RepID=A0A0B6ZI63_9EUPU
MYISDLSPSQFYIKGVSSLTTQGLLIQFHPSCLCRLLKIKRQNKIPDTNILIKVKI